MPGPRALLHAEAVAACWRPRAYVHALLRLARSTSSDMLILDGCAFEQCALQALGSAPGGSLWHAAGERGAAAKTS